MTHSEIWKDKLILTVNEEEDVLDIFQESLPEHEVTVHRATTFEKARELLTSFSYDLVILDIMGVRGFDLLKIAAIHKLPAVVLTAHAQNPEAFKKSIELCARAYLPKDILSSLVPFLEDILRLNYQSPGEKPWTKSESCSTTNSVQIGGNPKNHFGPILRGRSHWRDGVIIR